MIKMKDIAKECGVSQTTVSRIINGNTRVNPDVRQRVLEVIKKHDYHPNAVARSLVSNTSKLIGIIVTDIANPFFVDLIKVIEDEASRNGYSIILCNTDCDYEKEKKYVAVLKNYNVAGIIIVPCGGPATYFEQLIGHDLPTVVMTNDYPGYSSVSISHSLAGTEIANHFINLGYDRFIFFGDLDEDKEVGFRNGLLQHNIDLEKNYTVFKSKPLNTLKKNLISVIKEHTKHDGIGIFAYNDISAFHIMSILKDLDVNIPEQVAIVGFDNTFISREISPNLSSVAQPIDQIGIRSVESAH